MNKIKVHDKTFEPYLSEKIILKRVSELGCELSKLYHKENPIFLVVLNGAFMFASDLLKCIDFECEIHFIKLSSYEGMRSTGDIKTMIGLTENIENRIVIIVEDIIDTGKTLSALLPQLQQLQPKSLAICTLLQKTEALAVDLEADFIGFEIEDKFVIGYGLDYNNQGRNYPAIYQLDED